VAALTLQMGYVKHVTCLVGNDYFALHAKRRFCGRRRTFVLIPHWFRDVTSFRWEYPSCFSTTEPICCYDYKCKVPV
jgi:hypothetical protein